MANGERQVTLWRVLSTRHYPLVTKLFFMKKRTITILAFICFNVAFINDIWGQNKKGLSISFNMVRYAKTLGLFEAEYYGKEFKYFSGFDIAYDTEKRFVLFMGVRKVKSTVFFGGGEVAEKSDVNGMELRAGIELVPKRKRRFYLSCSMELFGEIDEQKGDYWVDYPPLYEINHIRNYIGFAPSLKANFRITKRISIYADARYKFGKVKMTGDILTKRGKTLYPDRSFKVNIFEPLNSFGLRFAL